MTLLRKQISWVHANIHAGINYETYHRFTALATSGGTGNLLIKTSASPSVHMIAQVITTGGPFDIEFYEDTTVSADGTGLTEINSNRQSANTTGVTAFHTPTVTGDGTLIYQTLVPGSSDNKLSFGGAAGNGHDSELILDVSSNYMLRVINNDSSNTQDCHVVLSWYEQ